jgi:hypothetical protein
MGQKKIAHTATRFVRPSFDSPALWRIIVALPMPTQADNPNTTLESFD